MRVSDCPKTRIIEHGEGRLASVVFSKELEEAIYSVASLEVLKVVINLD